MGGGFGLGGGTSRTSRFSDGMFGGFGPAESVFRSPYNESSQSGPRKAPTIENKLPCTLEELYNGSTRKMKISRNIVDVNGKAMSVEEILPIEVKPGWKKGTKITFPEKGNEIGRASCRERVSSPV